MKRTDVIYKYRVLPNLVLELSKGSKPLCVQVQKGIPQLWVRVDRDSGESEVRQFITLPTGSYVPQTARYIDTFQMEDGELVFHVFEVYK